MYKRTQIQKLFLASFIALLVISCGQGPRLQLDDQEAAINAKGTLKGKATSTESRIMQIPEDSKAIQTPQQKQPTLQPEDLFPETDFYSFENVEVLADFDKQTVEVEFEIVVPFLKESRSHKVKMEGTIEKEGPFKGFADLRVKQENENERAAPVIGKARCVDSCESLVVDLITRDDHGNLQNRQFQVLNGNRQKPSAPESSTSSKSTVPKASSTKNEASKEEIEVDFSPLDLGDNKEEIDDAGSTAVPGRFAAPIVRRDASSNLTQIRNYIVDRTSNENEKLEVSQRQVSPRQQRAQDVVILEDQQNSNFPLDLGPQYAGKSFNFYYSYCEINGQIIPGRLDRNNRCKQSKARVHHGAIDNASPITEALSGIFPNFGHSSKHYGSGFLVKYLEEAGKRFISLFPSSPIKVNDASLPQGGPVWSTKTRSKVLAHASHQNGLEADISLFRKSNATFDIEKNWELVKVLVDLGYTHLIYTDQQRIREMCRFAKNKKVDGNKTEFDLHRDKFEKLLHWPRHTTHFHLRLKCTPHNPSCKEDKSNPRATNPC